MIPIIKSPRRAIRTLVTTGFQNLANEVFPALALIVLERSEGVFSRLGFFVTPRLVLCLSKNDLVGDDLTVLSPQQQAWCAKAVRYDATSSLALIELDQLEPSSQHYLPVASDDFVSWRTPVLAVGGIITGKSDSPLALAMPGMVDGLHTLPAQPARTASGLFLDQMLPPQRVLRCYAMKIVNAWWGAPIIHGGSRQVVSVAAASSKSTPNIVMGPTPSDMRRVIFG